MNSIAVQNDTFYQWSAPRWERINQVQIEIAGETVREPLDPPALGVRYAEIEAIRREIEARSRKVVAENVTVLTPAQLPKLKALEEAQKLLHTVYDAQSQGLLPTSYSASSVLVSSPTNMTRAPLPGPPNPFIR